MLDVLTMHVHTGLLSKIEQASNQSLGNASRGNGHDALLTKIAFLKSLQKLFQLGKPIWNSFLCSSN